jgi:tetratricopeptide (TPR) repeat protein
MYRWIFVLAGATALVAADDPRLALALQAQTEFDRVVLASAPDLRDTLACVQTQASLLPLATPEELPLIHYHKGFCTLAGATVTHTATEFTDAAAEFDKAIEGWPARAKLGDKKKLPEPVPSALYVLASVARLNAGGDDSGLDRAQAQIAASVGNPACSSSIMPAAFCGDVLKIGRQWLGWIELRHDFLDEAARYLAGSAGTGWPEWVAGRKAFLARKYPDAASQFRQAINLQKRDATSLLDRLGPRPDFPAELTELGGAQLLAGNTATAIATLDEAVKVDPSNARALYLRARAKELAQHMDAAITDYNLASRTAFANAKDLASGEAHMYRGILLYRRKDYTHAEDEFSSALNFEISPGLREDATAWRNLAAVAGGSCDASRQHLERALSAVSPYFPKDEARTLMAACPSVSAARAPGGGLVK